MWFVPYTALGAELTEDYDSRINLRSRAAIFTQLGNFFGTVIPMALVGLIAAGGISTSKSWTIMAGILAFAGCLIFTITVITTKGHELIVDLSKNKTNIIKDTWEIIKAKPTKWLIGAILCYIFSCYILFRTQCVCHVSCNGCRDAYCTCSCTCYRNSGK